MNSLNSIINNLPSLFNNEYVSVNKDIKGNRYYVTTVKLSIVGWILRKCGLYQSTHASTVKKFLEKGKVSDISTIDELVAAGATTKKGCENPLFILVKKIAIFTEMKSILANTTITEQSKFALEAVLAKSSYSVMQEKVSFRQALVEFTKNMVDILNDPEKSKSYFQRTREHPEAEPQVVPAKVLQEFEKNGKLLLLQNMMGCDKEGKPFASVARVFDQIGATGNMMMKWSEWLVPSDVVRLPQEKDSKLELLKRIDEKEYISKWEDYVKECPYMKPFVNMENKEKVFYPGNAAMEYYISNKEDIKDFALGKKGEGDEFYHFLSLFETREMIVPKIRTDGNDSLPGLNRHNLSLFGSPVQPTVDPILFSQDEQGRVHLVMVNRPVSFGFKENFKPTTALSKEQVVLKNVPVLPGGMTSVDTKTGKLSVSAGLGQALQELNEEAMNAHIIVPLQELNAALLGLTNDEMKLIQTKDKSSYINTEVIVKKDRLGQSLKWQGAEVGQQVVTMRKPSDLEGKINPEILAKFNVLYDNYHAKMVENLPAEIKEAQKQVFNGKWDNVLCTEGETPVQFINFGDDRQTAHRVTRGLVFTNVITHDAMRNGIEKLLSAGSDAAGSRIIGLAELKGKFDAGEKWTAHEHFIALALIHNIVKGRIQASDEVKEYLTGLGYTVPAGVTFKTK